MDIFIYSLTAFAVVGGLIVAIWMIADVRRKAYEDYMKKRRVK